MKAGLISTILLYLESEDLSVVLQALRAVGNISCENGMRLKSVTLVLRVQKLRSEKYILCNTMKFKSQFDSQFSLSLNP